MKRLFLSTVIAVLPVLTQAETSDRIIRSVLSEHILPGVTNLAQKTALFAAAAQSDCIPSSEALRTSYGDAFDAWVSVSHLRFGPTEVDNRAFALAFWPDSRDTDRRTRSSCDKRRKLRRCVDRRARVLRDGVSSV